MLGFKFLGRLNQYRGEMGNFKNLTVYQKAFNLAMEIFEATKTFPPDERFALTSQLRRSLRSVCRAIGEGYRKRRYPNHFISKISDADMENSETQVSLDFALACHYLTNDIHQNLIKRSEEVGRLLNHMIKYPEKYSGNSLD